ncbi:MAG: hypothetical protein IPM69_07450 [Ignavibacteria bacterium]|nr:hypothetical protein [Ignavibacteria bacterium]
MKQSVHCTMMRDGQLSQQQVYTVEHSKQCVTIQEQATVESNKGIDIQCRFSVTPRAGFSAISLSVAKDGQTSHALDFTHHAADGTAMTVNGVSTAVEFEEGMVLVDGPNPLFDYANAMLLIGIQNQETCTHTVHALNWSKGIFYPMEYEFTKRDNTILINKKDFGITGEITLDPQTQSMTEASYTNGEHYFFRPV